jgi:hypothetical protein
MAHTLSAIDMTLWDITGKLWGMPIYRVPTVLFFPHPAWYSAGSGGAP